MMNVAGIVGEAVNRAIVTSFMSDGVGAAFAMRLFMTSCYPTEATQADRGIRNIQQQIRYTANQVITAFTPYLAREIVRGMVLSSRRSFPAYAVIIVTTSALAGAYKYYSRDGLQEGKISSQAAGMVRGAIVGALYSLVDLAGFDSSILGSIISYAGVDLINNGLHKFWLLKQLEQRELEGEQHTVNGASKKALLLQSLANGAILGLSRQGSTVAGSVVSGVMSMPLTPLATAIAASSLMAYTIYLHDTQKQCGSKIFTNISTSLLAVSTMATAAGIPLIPTIGGAYTLALVVFAIENYKFSVPSRGVAGREKAVTSEAGKQSEYPYFFSLVGDNLTNIGAFKCEKLKAIEVEAETVDDDNINYDSDGEEFYVIPEKEIETGEYRPLIPIPRLNSARSEERCL